MRGSLSFLFAHSHRGSGRAKRDGSFYPALLRRLPQAAENYARDFSQEPFVIEQYFTTTRFENDGTGEFDLTERIRVQSDAGVAQLGELVFGYSAASEQTEIRYVRVRKPDGTVDHGNR